MSPGPGKESGKGPEQEAERKPGSELVSVSATI